MRPLHKPFYLKIEQDKPNEQAKPRYEVTHILGQGGMGTVFKATDLKLRREVAIKAMDFGIPANADEEEISFAKKNQARFRLEARALANLDHPHIVKVTDLFEGQLANKPHCFYVMGYQEGTGTLEEMIKESGPLDKKNMIALIDQVGGALEYSHSKDVIHRDLKPSQILITRDREGNIVDSKLSDFGLAKMLKKSEGLQSVSGLTGEDDVLGTPVYMPPEQIDGSSPITEAADIYSWGATLFNAMAGELAMDFRGIGQTRLAYFSRVMQYKNGDIGIRKLSEFRDDLPEDMQMYIEKAMHPEPNQRTDSIKLLNKDIKNAYSPEKQSKVQRGPISQRLHQRKKSNTLIKTVGGILLTAAVLAGGYMLGNGNKTPDPIGNHIENPIPTDGTPENPIDNSNPNTTKDPITPTIDEKSKLSYHIHGNFDQASLHPYVEKGDRFIVKHQGEQLCTPEGSLDSNAGRFQIKVMYDETNQFVVPINLKPGETLAQHLWVPDFDPNDFRDSNNEKLTTSTWRYVTVDNNGQDNSFWKLDEWTMQDHANFVEKGVLEPQIDYLARLIFQRVKKTIERRPIPTFGQIKAKVYKDLEDRSKRVQVGIGTCWHQVIFRTPSDPISTESYSGGIHAQSFFRIQNKKIVPDPQYTQLTSPQMANFPTTSLMRGSAEDPLSETNAFAYTLAKEINKHLGSAYTVKTPSKEQHFIAMTGGIESSPIFAYGDRDQPNPQRLEYVNQVIANDFDSLRPLSNSSVSPFGVPISGGAPRQYTDLMINKGKVQMFYTAQFYQNGFSVTEHKDPDKRSAMNGATYVIERAN